MAKKGKKGKKKKLSKYEKVFNAERELFRASKQPLVEKTHKEWKESYLRYHELDLKRKDMSITSDEHIEMFNLKMPPVGWAEDNKIKLPKPKKSKKLKKPIKPIEEEEEEEEEEDMEDEE